MKDRQYIENLENYKYSADVVTALTSSALISFSFDFEEVAPLHLLLGFLIQEDCPINNFFLRENICLETDLIIEDLISDSDFYTQITGEISPFLSTNTKINNEGNISNTNVSCNANSGNQETGYQNYYINDFIFLVSDSVKEIISNTAIACLNGKQTYIDSVSLLYALITSSDNSVRNLLDHIIQGYFGTRKSLGHLVDFLLCNYKIFDNYSADDIVIIPKTLSNCCSVMNNDFTFGAISDIYGRDSHLKKLWTVFSKKTKRNAILLGEPGVGKTAIVEYLVQNIVNKSCPTAFQNYTVISLNITSMLSGTAYRGEFEQKIDNLISFLQSTHNVILFIDEIHHMVGAGSTEESNLDLSGALKPVLSRDDLIVLGATTYKEYEKIISKDTALKRRFEIIEVKGPKFDEIKPMILGRVETLSKFHKVKISDKLLDYVILLSCVFGSSTNQPDASIDLLDKSMSVVKLRGGHSVSHTDVKSVFDENFKDFEKQSKTFNKATAVHEAGHYIALRVYEEILNRHPIAVSIIPSYEFAGATFTEDNDCLSNSHTYKFACAEASVSLAGRLAQELYSYDYDFGAGSDLEKANDIITHMLLKSGMAHDYPNIVLGGSEQADILFNPKDKENIAAERKKIIDNLSNITFYMLQKHQKQLDEIVKLLMRKHIVDYKELDAVFSQNAVEGICDNLNFSYDPVPTESHSSKRKIGSNRKKIHKAGVS